MFHGIASMEIKVMLCGCVRGGKQNQDSISIHSPPRPPLKRVVATE
jgi:hypothetical protein